MSGNIACSKELNGPDSTTSVDSAPVRATTTSTAIEPVVPNATPDKANPRNSNPYSRRRPTRSPYRPTTTVSSPVPARIADSSTATRVADHPSASSVTPRNTEAKP